MSVVKKRKKKKKSKKTSTSTSSELTGSADPTTDNVPPVSDPTVTVLGSIEVCVVRGRVC